MFRIKPVTLAIIHYLEIKDFVILFTVSKIIRDLVCRKLVPHLKIPVYLYASLADKNYHAVRDYYAIKYLQQFAGAKPNFGKVRKTLKLLTVSKLLLTPDEKKDSQEEKSVINKEWKEMISILSERTRKSEWESLRRIKSDIKDIYFSAKRLNDLFVKKTAIVVTFPHTIEGDTLKNCFQINKETEKKSIKEEYFFSRLTAEFIHYAEVPTRLLQAFTIKADAHLCYGTLQFIHSIRPTTNYGDNFIVFKDSIRSLSTISYGAPLDQLRAGSPLYAKPVTFEQLFFPLLVNVPKSELQYYAVHLDQPANITYHQDTQYEEEKSRYLEVQIPSGLSLDKNIRHVHYDAKNDVRNLQNILEMKADYNISVGINPFECHEFSSAFLREQENEFLLKKIINYIRDAALILAETNEQYLKIKDCKDYLEFNFVKITTNQPYFHQAQASAILYLLGVRDYFKKISAIQFAQTSLRYSLPLSGRSQQIGDLSDHDAYTYHPNSLAHLLNTFVKRIISIFLVSRQNEYFLFNEQSCQVGAIEESNQTKPLNLYFMEGFRYFINVYWFYDNLIIEINADSAIYQEAIKKHVHRVLATIFDAKDLVLLKNRIWLKQSLSIILNKMKEKWISYKSVILYDDVNHIGSIYLARAIGGAYCSEGGKNKDPFSRADILQTEFAKSDLKDCCDLIKNLKLINISNADAVPRVAFYALPKSCAPIDCLDESEFVKDSLQKFNIFELGNLSSKQVCEVAKSFNLSAEEYKKKYGNALPLMHYSSIFEYLKLYCEKELNDFIFKLFNKLIPVKIVTTGQEIRVGSRTCWLPSDDFGKFKIAGNKGDLDGLSQILKKIAPKSSFELVSENKDKQEEKKHEWLLTVSGINPQQMLDCSVQQLHEIKKMRYKDTRPEILSILFSLHENMRSSEFLHFKDVCISLIKNLDPDCEATVFIAIENKMWDVVQFLFENMRVNIDAVDDQQRNILLAAMSNGASVEIIEYLKKFGVKIPNLLKTPDESKPALPIVSVARHKQKCNFFNSIFGLFGLVNVKNMASSSAPQYVVRRQITT